MFAMQFKSFEWQIFPEFETLRQMYYFRDNATGRSEYFSKANI